MKNKLLVTYIGKRLRMRRTMLGLSQEEVAKGIGVAPQQVQKYEKGTNVLNVIRLYEFSHFLKVPVVYFFEGLEEQSSQKAHGRGFAEENVEFEAEFKPTSDRETLEVIKSFKRIKDHALRKRVADLLRTLSQKDI